MAMAMTMPNAGSDLPVTTSDKPPKTLKKEKRVEKGKRERKEWEDMKELKHDQEIIKLKKRGWPEEIDRKHAELVGAQAALEKLHQLLKMEKEMPCTFPFQ
ncbi:hypothetical protein D5086_000821 [Populus alba]|uniref:Uncharacterized protein n=1 Tax=Populus alba TaxID=43335 RepID=A0ACC4CZ26_POPAL